jgi:hypothetical protein
LAELAHLYHVIVARLAAVVLVAVLHHFQNLYKLVLVVDYVLGLCKTLAWGDGEAGVSSK